MVEVIRNKKKEEIPSEYLVPGDIFIPKGEIMCDALLLKGDLFLN